MEQELSFSKQGSMYIANYISTGDTIVQFSREAIGKVGVSAYITGMPSVRIFEKVIPSQYILFKVCIPSGMNVVIESETEVTSAKLFVEE